MPNDKSVLPALEDFLCEHRDAFLVDRPQRLRRDLGNALSSFANRAHTDNQFRIAKDGNIRVMSREDKLAAALLAPDTRQRVACFRLTS